MTVTGNLPELALRSSDADWNRERWELLPNDGNRYEVIDGVLYMATAPSNFHQWILRQNVGSDAKLISPTLPFRAPVANFFAGAPDTTL